VTGGIAALWLAPQSGKQTQKLVHKQGEALKHQADKAVSQVVEQIEESATQAVDHVEALRHDAEQLINDRVDHINQAATSVKKAVSG
jgi:gas vesicle protein